MTNEIRHYKVPIPAKCSMTTYENEYIFLHRIRQEEIVWTWHWDQIEAWLESNDVQGQVQVWETRVARPAFEEHERARKAGETPRERDAKMVELMRKLMPEAVNSRILAATQGCLFG